MTSICRVYESGIRTSVTFSTQINLQTDTWSAPINLRVTIQLATAVARNAIGIAKDMTVPVPREDESLGELFAVCRECIELLFNQYYNDLVFSMNGSTLVLDPAVALESVSNIPSFNITKAAIEIPTLTRSVPFEGLTKDGVRYTAKSCMSYLQLGHDDPESDDIDLVTQLELDRCRELFVQEWSERTLEDIIETYPSRSPEEQRPFSLTCEPNVLKSVHIYNNIAVIQYQCKLDAHIEAGLVRRSIDKQVKRDCVVTWIFYCLLGLIGGYLYGKLRYSYRSFRGLHNPGSNAYLHNSNGVCIRNCYEYSKSWPSTAKNVITAGYPFAIMWFLFASLFIYVTIHNWYVQVLMTTISVVLFGPAGALVYLV